MHTGGRPIRDICSEFFDSLPVPDPFTLSGFVASAGTVLDTKIELVAARPGATMSCGGLVCTPEATLVWYPANTSVLYQLHVLLHELGHIVLDHAGSLVTLSADDDRVLRALRRMMPDLPVELIGRVLRRSHYEDEDEQQAEQFATVGGPRLHRMILRSRCAGPHDVDVARLRTLFALPSEAGDHG